MTSVEAQCEAATIEYWFHCDDPVTNHETYLTLLEGLAEAKAEWRRALIAHDLDLAGQLLAEVRDLNEVCAAAAEAITLQRCRFVRDGKPWPLTPMAAYGGAHRP